MDSGTNASSDESNREGGEAWDVAEQYENALHSGQTLAPAQWLLALCPPLVRRQLEDIHLIYRSVERAPIRRTL